MDRMRLFNDLDEQRPRPERGQGSDYLEASEYLRRIAHELLSPLTTLRLSLQMGRMRVQRGEAMELPAIERALAQVEEMTTLVTKLRSAAHIVAGEGEPTKQRIDLRELLCQATERIAHHHGDRCISFQAPHGPARVEADRFHIEQVLEHLLDNACKFSRAGSAIVVSLTTGDKDTEFCVADAGIGIPLPAQERVFDMFFRAANASSCSAHGFGLGLFIARELVTRHAGRIWVDSELDRGSTFHVALPKSLVA